MNHVIPVSTNRSALFKIGVLYLVAAALAVGLKVHYSRADSRALEWILKPTAFLVECLSGTPFTPEAGTGYISNDRHTVIAPGCAGVNFLIASFCMAACRGLTSRRSVRAGVCWLGFSMAAATALTLCVNAVRITLSMHLYEADIYGGWLTPDRVHRIAGCAIYFLSLSLFYPALQKIAPAGYRSELPEKAKRGVWMAGAGLSPFFWYCLIVLVIPFFNRILRQTGHPAAEHCWTVLTVSAVVFLLVFLIRSAWRLMELKRVATESKQN